MNFSTAQVLSCPFTNFDLYIPPLLVNTLELDSVSCHPKNSDIIYSRHSRAIYFLGLNLFSLGRLVCWSLDHHHHHLIFSDTSMLGFSLRLELCKIQLIEGRMNTTITTYVTLVAIPNDLLEGKSWLGQVIIGSLFSDVSSLDC